MKAKSENWISTLNWVESNTSWTVKIRVYTLMCVSEEPLQYVANQSIHVARHLYILPRDKTIDLPYDLLCHTTSLWCLRHTIFAYDKLMHSCDVKTMIYHFLNTIIYRFLEYNIQVLTIEMTGRKPWCIRVQITAVTSTFYFMLVLCVLCSKTLKR